MNQRQLLQSQIQKYYLTHDKCTLLSQLIGTTRDKFKEYIEKLLQPDMNSINMGKLWEFDHIVPVTVFDESELSICYHYLNIIPMYKRHNRMKGASVHFSYQLLNKRLQKDKENQILIQLKDRCKQIIDEFDIYC